DAVEQNDGRGGGRAPLHVVQGEAARRDRSLARLGAGGHGGGQGTGQRGGRQSARGRRYSGGASGARRPRMVRWPSSEVQASSSTPGPVAERSRLRARAPT